MRDQTAHRLHRCRPHADVGDGSVRAPVRPRGLRSVIDCQLNVGFARHVMQRDNVLPQQLVLVGEPEPTNRLDDHVAEQDVSVLEVRDKHHRQIVVPVDQPRFDLSARRLDDLDVDVRECALKANKKRRKEIAVHGDRHGKPDAAGQFAVGSRDGCAGTLDRRENVARMRQQTVAFVCQGKAARMAAE